ncbi:MAG TPA: tyrosine--tRNA ligase [Flavobacteriales bacterium]|nr:tyrosine--tRNA ligase [Flavobacteriales bacterium]HIA10896.1 tyrosine--tRNA ligase [Flavobacteriales bacterium]HIO73262.1 tyrosine--tRNA ligase [Flavobacteriales bacterium]
MKFVEELKWRGMLQDIIPGTEEQLSEASTTGYIGFDPTAPSLTVGNLVPIMLLVHYQRAGHKPIALVGGATGMIGDPSGKDKERQLLDEETLNKNVNRIKDQLGKFLDFDSGDNKAEMINNYDFYKGMEIFEFFREIGKHLTVSYMISKDSVKNRLDGGMSFTEFSYQLFQGYDFLWLFKNKNCLFQMGGSDQWGNITSGAELIRRKEGGKVFALTCPLLTKNDGTKFGKTEEGNIWLDPEKTSPYKFYQFWLNSSDEDASKYIRIFSTKTKEEIEKIEKQHAEAPHLRGLQKLLAEEITIRVHSENDLKTAITASEILFGKGTAEALRDLKEESLLDIFEGVPQSSISKEDIENGVGIVEFLAEKTDVLASKGEARRSISGGGISINKTKVESEDYSVDSGDLLNDKYILVQKGKKNYHLVTVG